MAKKKTGPKSDAVPPSAVVPAVPMPPPDDPLKRQQETEPSSERAKQMAEARVAAMRKMGRIKDK